MRSTALWVALALAAVESAAGTTSPLDSLTRKTYGDEYHMPVVRVVHARVQDDKPALMEGRFVSKYGKDLASGYLAGLDTANTASIEGAMMTIQADGINQNGRSEAERCTRKDDMKYIVFFEILVAQTNETIAEYDSYFDVLEYGPYVLLEDGQCKSRWVSDKSTPPECFQLNGDDSEPNVGPFIGAEFRSEDSRAPYPYAYWFSFPNTCPLKIQSEKTDACRASTRKGLCDLGQAPDGVMCTYAYDILGWVPLDDLVGITSLKDSSGKPYKDFTTWCEASESNIEFAGNVASGAMDKGLDFWSDARNQTRNGERAAKLVALYKNITAGVFKSTLIPDSDLKNFKPLPSAETLEAANPPCFKSVRKCNTLTGCKRVGLSQICTPCKSGEVCPMDANFTIPKLVKGTPGPKYTALESGGTTNGTSGTLAPTPAPQSTSKSGLSTALIVGGVVVLVVGIVVFFLKRRGCACFGHGRQPKKSDPSNLADADNTSGADGAYVAMSTPNKLNMSVGTDAVAVYSHKTDSRPKQTIVDDEDEFPGRLLLSVRIPLEHLQIGDVISHGGFGQVLFGTYQNQDVAVKRLLAERRRDSKSVSSFIQEIKLNATLDHPCLVRFIGAAWDVRENLCMVSEYVRGGDLRTLLSGYAHTGYPNGYDGSKLRTAIQIAQALTYLHSLDTPVVHRDLKSRNVLLTKLLDAKLIDFGVSTECLDETMTAGVGTSLWMAPEIMMGKRYDVKADVFSFGVILSELDTHEIPYDHVRDPESDRKLASALLNRLIYEGKVKPRFTEKADLEIVALARDCLELDPSKRPTSAQVLERIRRGGRQGGRPSSQTDTQSSHTDTPNSLLFETRATTKSGDPE